jgi:orotidine-5'-phosphate decarboxylase
MQCNTEIGLFTKPSNNKGEKMKSARDYIIFPLDVPTLEEAIPYIECLSGYVGMFKLGLELFIRSGPEAIKAIRSKGNTGIFLDLKLHDIPETVKRAVTVLAEFDVTFTTVHCGESVKMLEAAVEGAKGRVGILAVTVLTSVSRKDIMNAGFNSRFSSDLTGLVMARAETAKNAGCAGVICSGLEAGAIKGKFGADFLAVTPGIRPNWDGTEKDDQKRVMTPSQAIKGGSDYLVIGRPIRDAKDPRKAAIKIADEIHATNTNLP